MTQHLRNNAIAYLALFVALGGTGAYAASKIDSGDIKDNSIKGKDIRTGQVAASDLRDGSATGDDVADESLTGADVQDKSLGGQEINPATKVPNADMLDGHGSTRYGVGLEMGVALEIPANGNSIRFPAGLSRQADEDFLAITPEVLELRDFTARAEGLTGGEQVTVALEGSSLGTPCVLTTANPVCHNPSNEQSAVPAQGLWGIRFTGSGLSGDESVTYSYRAVR